MHYQISHDAKCLPHQYMYSTNVVSINHHPHQCVYYFFYVTLWLIRATGLRNASDPRSHCRICWVVTQVSGIESLESIPGLLKRYQIRALGFLKVENTVSAITLSPAYHIITISVFYFLPRLLNQYTRWKMTGYFILKGLR